MWPYIGISLSILQTGWPHANFNIGSSRLVLPSLDKPIHYTGCWRPAGITWSTIRRRKYPLLIVWYGLKIYTGSAHRQTPQRRGQDVSTFNRSMAFVAALSAPNHARELTIRRGVELTHAYKMAAVSERQQSKQCTLYTWNSNYDVLNNAKEHGLHKRALKHSRVYDWLPTALYPLHEFPQLLDRKHDNNHRRILDWYLLLFFNSTRGSDQRTTPYYDFSVGKKILGNRKC